MPFLYPLLEIKPRSALIMITQRCNLRCVMCRQWKEVPKDELLTVNWKKIIKDLKRNNIINIHFTGGEPFLRADLCELIHYSSKNGFTTGITTNGMLLNEDNLRNLIDKGLNSIAISVDALGAKYEELRGIPNSFMRIKETLRLVSDARKKKRIDVYINFTLMKNTIEDFKKVKNLADKLELPMAINLLDKNSYIFGVEENKDKFWISEKNDFAELEEMLNFVRDEKIKKPGSLIINFPAIDFIKEYFKDPIQRKIACISSQDRIFIDPYGEICGGCLSMGSFGNINNKPLSDLLKEKRYKIAKKNMFFKICSGCSCGYLFNIQCIPTFMVKDLFLRAKHFVFEKK